MIRHILLYITLAMLPMALTAAEPVVKTAVVTPDTVYEDAMKIPFDDKGVDITVHFAFDENNNKLTLSIAGSRKLFVFEGDTYMKQVFHGKWFCRKRFYPERLAYPVLVQPRTRYLLSKQVRKGYKKPRGKHLFNRWLECSKELKTIMPKEYPLGTDSIVQRFDVDPSATKVSVTLRNILVVDPAAGLVAKVPVAGSGKMTKYEFVYDNDMATTYNITLKRNPCYDMDARIDSIANAASAVEEAYRRLMKSSPNGTNASKAAIDVFNQHKQFLLSQYQHINDSCDCTDMMNQISHYNQYVDSIAAADCKYENDAEKAKAKIAKAKMKIELNAKMLLHAAHNLDDVTAKILNSKDPIEQHDLATEGKEIINTVTVTLRQRKISTAEQRHALSVYKRAEQYFMTLINGK